MKKLKKIFGNFHLTWKFLIIFSIVIGVIVGILNRIPFLQNTSFQDIAIWLDMWIILAIFVIVNCKSSKEAVAKCFVFFLISQPLIYLTEIIINLINKNGDFTYLFVLYFRNYYIGAGWLFATFLTIPGAFIAYQIKKNNILSSLILSVATIYLSFVGAKGLVDTISNFPYHLINNLICLIMSYVLIFVILEKKKPRYIAIVLTFIGMLAGLGVALFLNSKPAYAYELLEIKPRVEIVDYIIENENIVNIEKGDSNDYVILKSSKEKGETEIKLIDKEENEYRYLITVDSKKMEIKSIGEELQMEDNKKIFKLESKSFGTITGKINKDSDFILEKNESNKYLLSSEKLNIKADIELERGYNNLAELKAKYIDKGYEEYNFETCSGCIYSKSNINTELDVCIVLNDIVENKPGEFLYLHLSKIDDKETNLKDIFDANFKEILNTIDYVPNYPER